ncbi:MAG: hypothetical protein AAF891_00015 [Pseudomonadota bacterium]
MQDQFKNVSPSMESPASRLFAITPSDSEDLDLPTTAINVQTSGTVRVTTLAGDVGDVFIAAGIPFPIRVTRVWSTGTTATGIRGLSG